MQKLKNIQQGLIQGKRIAIEADPITNELGPLKTEAGETKSKWGTIVAAGEDVENMQVGDKVMYHENSVTEFPFNIPKEDTKIFLLTNYDVTNYTDIIYVLPKKEVDANI